MPILVEIGQSAIDRGHDLADILSCCALISLVAASAKCASGMRLEIDMRLSQLGGLRNHDVSVDIDRYG